MTPRERARLVHDVAKYVARTARNLPPAPTPEMVAMLVRDLYELRPGRRASSLFAELAPPSPLFDDVRALLAEADELEAAVRAGDAAAVTRAAAIACEVERRIRTLATEGA
jgi:hypothetical protein